MTLEEKYGIVYIDRRRYYIEDLTKRNFDVECATPYRFSCTVCNNNIEILDITWNNMIYKIAVELGKIIFKSKEEYLALSNDWGKQKVFSCEKLKNYMKFNDIYINLNHTAVHALWTIQLLLDFYGVDRKGCQLLLRRHGSAEPKEAQEFYQNKTIEGFNLFLQNVYAYSKEQCAKIIKNLHTLNKIMPQVSRSYDNIFLLEDGNMLNNYIKKILEILKYQNNLSTSQLAIVQKCVSLLSKYYYYTYNSKRNNQ